MKVKWYLVTIHTGKALDSLNYAFLVNALQKFGFVKTFMDWIKIFLNEWESYVIN